VKEAMAGVEEIREEMRRRFSAMDQDVREGKANRESDLQIIEKALMIAHTNQEKVLSLAGTSCWPAKHAGTYIICASHCLIILA
jgi:hypothetical protein